MKPFILLTITFLALSVCGQTTKDTAIIFRNLSFEICNCTFSKMKDNKPSATLDSCHKAMVLKYNESLKEVGIDPLTEVGIYKILNEVDRKLLINCPELTKLVQKEYDGGKLKFSGELVSQKKLTSGLYEVIMMEVASKEIKTFLAKTLVDDSLINKYNPGYVLTLEYEIVKNQQTNKDEYYLKADGTFSIMGIMKVAAQK
ncbi:MAG: hypothetical protein ACT4OJ_10985 [Bacteroidota bacterium]